MLMSSTAGRGGAIDGTHTAVTAVLSRIAAAVSSRQTALVVGSLLVF